jgi:hypothetical protein
MDGHPRYSLQLKLSFPAAINQDARVTLKVSTVSQHLGVSELGNDQISAIFVGWGREWLKAKCRRRQGSQLCGVGLNQQLLIHNA